MCYRIDVVLCCTSVMTEEVLVMNEEICQYDFGNNQGGLFDLIERVLGQGCSAVPWPSCQPSSASTAIGKAPRKIG